MCVCVCMWCFHSYRLLFRFYDDCVKNVEESVCIRYICNILCKFQPPWNANMCKVPNNKTANLFMNLMYDIWLLQDSFKTGYILTIWSFLYQVESDKNVIFLLIKLKPNCCWNYSHSFSLDKHFKTSSDPQSINLC